MAIAQQKINSEDDFLKVGSDAIATFDNSPSNPTEHAGSENLRALKTEDDDLEDEDADEEEDEDDVDDEEEDEDDEDEDVDEADEIDEDVDLDEEDDEDEVEEDDHDLAKGPRAPSVYRKV